MYYYLLWIFDQYRCQTIVKLLINISEMQVGFRNLFSDL